MDQYYPPFGAAPPPPPLPDIAVIERPSWGRYGLVALISAALGAAAVFLLS
jgi:ubiquinone biosynthesis protein